MQRTHLSFEQLAGSLESKAAQRNTVTYNELAAELSLPPVNNMFSNHPLSSFFEQIDIDDAWEQRPLRTALVVLKKTGMPSSGFFHSMELHRENKIAAANEAPTWRKELESLFDYYDPTRPKATLCIELSHSQSRRLDRLCKQAGRAPKELVQHTLSSLLDELEDEFAANAEAREQVDRGEVLDHDEVFARIDSYR